MGALPPWISALPSLIAAVAAAITVFVALRIAENQNKLQTALADKQIEIQARQLKKDLFDRRFAVFIEAAEFIGYVLQENGKIELVGPGKYRRFRESMEVAQMLFGEDV